MLEHVASYIYLVFGKISSRVCPILFGYYLVRFHSEGAYSNFVELITLSNVFITVAVFGMSSQILSERVGEDKKRINDLIAVYNVALFCVSAFSFIYSLFITQDNNYLTAFSLVLYITGYSWLSLYDSLSCRIGNYRSGAKAYSITTIMIFILVSIGIAVDIQDDLMVILFCFVYTFVGFFFFACYLVIESYRLSFKSIIVNAKRMVLNSFDVIVFGFSLMGSIYLLLEQISVGSEKYIFALGYQLFSVAVFLPNVFSNMLVPKLSNKKDTVTSIYLVMYFLSSLCVLLIFLLSGEIVYSLYNLDFSIYNKKVLFIILLSSVLASIGSYFTQIFNSQSRYYILRNAGAILLLTVLCLMRLFKTDEALSAAFTLLSGYVVFLGYLFYSYFVSKSRIKYKAL